MPAGQLDDVVTLPCACANLRRAARAVTQLYDRHLRSAGLRVTQFTLLQALSRSGLLRQGRLGDVLALDSTTLTRTLSLLRRAGWIRSTVGADRRERYWELTPSGRKRLDRALPKWEAAQTELKRRLGGASWNALQEATVGVVRAAWPE